MSPLFSIITVTYNAESTLPPTLESVREQTCSLYEYIVMDGVSKDKTLKLAIDAGIPQAKISSSKDTGIYDAMNKAIDIATGEYLIFLNAGDTFHSADTLDKIAKTIMDYDFPGIVYGQTDLVDSQRRYIAPRHLTIIDYLNEGTTTANRRASLIERMRIMGYYYGWIPTIARHVAFIPRFIRQRRKERSALNSLE